MSEQNVTYVITVTRYWKEEGEIGNQWKPTGKKDADGHDEYGYTPSLIGMAEKSKQVLSQYVEHEIDIAALQRLINRKPKGGDDTMK